MPAAGVNGSCNNYVQHAEVVSENCGFFKKWHIPASSYSSLWQVLTHTIRISWH
jgi:hypothetical protein